MHLFYFTVKPPPTFPFAPGFTSRLMATLSTAWILTDTGDIRSDRDGSTLNWSRITDHVTGWLLLLLLLTVLYYCRMLLLPLLLLLVYAAIIPLHCQLSFNMNCLCTDQLARTVLCAGILLVASGTWCRTCRHNYLPLNVLFRPFLIDCQACVQPLCGIHPESCICLACETIRMLGLALDLDVLAPGDLCHL